MPEQANRLTAVVLTVTDLDRSAQLYQDGFGLDLHLDDHEGDDRWISGRHAATSWTDGAFIHFAIYATKDGEASTRAQIAFRVADLDAAHARAVAAGARVIHEPKAQPWGRSARYFDLDDNIIELTPRELKMRVFRIAIPVSRIAESSAFYESVLAIDVDDTVPSRLYFHCGEVIIALIDWTLEGRADLRPTPDNIYLATDDLDAVYERAVAAGARVVSPIEARGWGERSFYCLDPDGNQLCFVDDSTLFLGRGADWT